MCRNSLNNQYGIKKELEMQYKFVSFYLFVITRF